LYTLKPECTPISHIVVSAGSCRWTLHIRTLLGLHFPGEPVLACGGVLFTGEDGVFPVLPDDPMYLEIAPWQEEQDNPFARVDTQLQLETPAEYWSWDALDLMPYLSAPDCGSRRFSLKDLCEDRGITFSEGPVAVRLDGPVCREDSRVTFYPISDGVELLPCRIGEHACLRLGNGETIIQSDEPILLEEGLCKNKVSGTLAIDKRGRLTAKWTPIIGDALLVKEDSAIIGGNIITMGDLWEPVELLLLSEADRDWAVNIGEASASFHGPARVSFIQLLNECNVGTAGITVPVEARLEGRPMAEWALDLTPTVNELECCWTQEQPSAPCNLKMQGAWFGCCDMPPRLVLYVDGHRIKEFAISTGDEELSITARAFDKHFLIEAHQIGFYRDAGEIRLEAVFGERVLARVLVAPCPYIPPPPDPEHLKQMIREVLQQARKPHVNADACYEQALYLTEQYAAQIGQMPFSADALCAQLGMSPTADAAGAGLYLMEALLSHQVLMRALPTALGVGRRCGLTVLTLRVFYEVFLFSNGMGMPARLAEYTAEVRKIGATISNARLRSWAATVAAYGNATLPGEGVLPIEGEYEARMEAARAPMMTFYAPFNKWLTG